MDSSPTRHLVTVWNPSYANAMDETIQLLLDRARDFRAGKIREEDDVFVWWGKIRSGHRQSKLPHLDEVLSIESDIGRETDPREVHPYITDFRSLYVGHVGEIRDALRAPSLRAVRAASPGSRPVARQARRLVGSKLIRCTLATAWMSLSRATRGK